MRRHKRTAIVTGAGQGIGRAVALKLAQRGWAVDVNDVDREKVTPVVDEIRSAGGTAEPSVFDVSSWAEAEAMAAQCLKAYGQLDLLVNNAGILRDRMSFNMSEDEWDSVIAVNLKGVFNCIHFAARAMRERKSGHIINVCSRSGLRGRIGQSNYAAAKGGVMGLTLTVAQEMKKYEVACNAIVPRASTEMTESIPRDLDKQRTSAVRKEGLRERGTPDEVTPLVEFLAGLHGTGITGQIFGIGGDKLSVWRRPQESCVAFQGGGWTDEDVAAVLKGSFSPYLTDVMVRD